MKQDTPVATNPLFTPEQLQGILAVLQLQAQNDPLRQLDLEDKLRAKAEREEEAKSLKEARRQNALTMEKMAQEKELQQEYCSHIKPNRTTHVIGQRDHNQVYHFFCQGCQKEFVGLASFDNPRGLRADLVPDMNMVGGPQI